MKDNHFVQVCVENVTMNMIKDENTRNNKGIINDDHDEYRLVLRKGEILKDEDIEQKLKQVVFDVFINYR